MLRGACPGWGAVHMRGGERMTWLRKALKWLTADRWRWLVLPAIAAGLVGLVRLAWRRGIPSLPRPGPAPMTPAEGENAHDQVDDDLEEELDAIDQEVEEAIEEGTEKYGKPNRKEKP